MGTFDNTYTYPYLIDRVNMDIEERMLVLCLMIDPQILTRVAAKMTRCQAHCDLSEFLCYSK